MHNDYLRIKILGQPIRIDILDIQASTENMETKSILTQLKEHDIRCSETLNHLQQTIGKSNKIETNLVDLSIFCKEVAEEVHVFGAECKDKVKRSEVSDEEVTQEVSKTDRIPLHQLERTLIHFKFIVVGLYDKV
jgi:hypothetical protein